MDRLIVKVRDNKSNKQRIITIPKENKDINVGDYVEVTKI